MRSIIHCLSIVVVMETLVLAPVANAQAPEVEGPKIDDELPKAKSGIKPYQIELVETETTEAQTQLLIHLDRIPDDKDMVTITEHGTFLEISLRDSVVPETGKFYEGAGPYLIKVAAFQPSPELGALRLFLSKEAATIQKAISYRFAGDTLIVSLDHRQLEGLGITSHLAPAKIEGSPNLAEVVAKTKVRSDIPDPATAADGTTSPQFAELPKKMIWAAVFSVVMLVGLGVFHFFRRSLRSRLDADFPKSASMRLLDTVHLAPKQRLTLMDIGGQQILLGVSPDGINYLTTVSPPPKKSDAQLVNPSFGPAVGLERGLGENRQMALPTAAKVPKARSEIVPPQPAAALNKTRQQDTGRLAVRIDDSGIHQETKTADKRQPQALDDVTRLIRSKLKNIP